MQHDDLHRLAGVGEEILLEVARRRQGLGAPVDSLANEWPRAEEWAGSMLHHGRRTAREPDTPGGSPGRGRPTTDRIVVEGWPDQSYGIACTHRVGCQRVSTLCDINRTPDAPLGDGLRPGGRHVHALLGAGLHHPTIKHALRMSRFHVAASASLPDGQAWTRFTMRRGPQGVGAGAGIHIPRRSRIRSVDGG